jgi:hypothetical protein
MACLIQGANPYKAAAFGVSLASRGVTVSGVRETYRLTAGIGAAELRKK